MDLLSLLILLCIVWITYNLWLIPLITPLNKIPGPKRTSLFMGNWFDITSKQPGEQQSQWQEKYGDIVKYEFWLNWPRVMICGSDAIKHVLVTNYQNYRKSDITVKNIAEPFQDGLLLVEGEVHKIQRKIIQPIFTYSNLVKMIPIFVKKTNQLLSRWDKIVAQRLGNQIEVTSEMSNLTLDVIGLAACAHDFGTINDKEGRLSKAYKSFISSTQMTWKLMLYLIPGWSLLPLPRNLQIKRDTTIIAQSIQRVMKEKKEKPKSDQPDLLDLLMAAADEETGAKLTPKQVRNNVLTFMFAGHETTSVAMSWVLYMLSQHPEVDAKVFEEIQTVLEEEDSTITSEQLEQLQYLDHVIKETMRLYPPVHSVLRTAVKDDVICGNNLNVIEVNLCYFDVSKTRLTIWPYLQHMSAKYWKDPKSFNPDRWLDEEQVKEASACGFLPFIIGPRSCIGSKFAKLEMKVALAMILKKYSFKLVDGRVLLQYDTCRSTSKKESYDYMQALSKLANDIATPKTMYYT